MKSEFKNIKIQTALGLSAASALIYEVVATHMLFFYFIESSYSIATVLSVFLSGLAIGSLTIYYLSNRIKNKKLLFAVLQISIALYAFFILSNLRNILPEISTMGTFLTSFIILLVPTYFLGAIFPLAGSLLKKDKKEIIGLAYSSDLFGAIIGSLFAGFFLIPGLGAKNTVIIGAGLNLISALIIISKKQKIIPIFFIIFLIGTSFNIPSLTTDSTDIISNQTSEYQYYANSPYGLVTVKNNTLYIEGRSQCSCNYPNHTSEKMMVTYALEPLQTYSDLTVLNIGLGCGLTLEKCLDYKTIVDVVEINEKVVEANKVMTDVLKSQRVNLIIDDGLNYLRDNEKKYDSIIIDIENPSVAHSSNLYTVEAFEIIHNSLSETGTFSLWSYRGSNRYYDILYYSLKEEFSFVYQYPGVFLATKYSIEKTEYKPKTPYEINTIDRNTLTNAYLNI